MRIARQYFTVCLGCLLLITMVGKGIFYPETIPVTFIGKYDIQERHVPMVYQVDGMQYGSFINYITNQSTIAKMAFKPLRYLTVSCRTKVKPNSVPLVWDNGIADWYNITKSDTFKASKISFGTTKLDSEQITGLLKSHRDTYRQLGKLFRNNNPNPMKVIHEKTDPSKGQIATFDDVIVSAEGHILHIRKCKAVINGGCKTPSLWSVPKKPVPVYDKVVSLTVYWGFGIWHFLMEAFVGLAHVSKEEINTSFVHVSSKNGWTMNWLKIAGISEDRVITGTIVAKTLLLPEMGRCGRPSFAQIQWLRSIIPSKVPKYPHSIVFIKRTKKRAMQNNELQKMVEKYSKKNNLEFILHADNALPSVPEQLQRFANAEIVIGPHGAGLVNLIASKKGTCVIEFLPPDLNICYMHLSALLGHRYFSVPLYKNKIVNIQKVERILHLCNKK